MLPQYSYLPTHWKFWHFLFFCCLIAGILETKAQLHEKGPHQTISQNKSRNPVVKVDELGLSEMTYATDRISYEITCSAQAEGKSKDVVGDRCVLCKSPIRILNCSEEECQKSTACRPLIENEELEKLDSLKFYNQQNNNTQERRKLVENNNNNQTENNENRYSSASMWDGRKHFCGGSQETRRRFSYPLSCRQYVECIDKVPYVRNCPMGTSFHQQLLVCLKEDETSKICVFEEHLNSLNFKVSKEGKNTLKETNPAKRRVKRKSCSSADYYIQPHPSHCNKFEICSNEKITEGVCGVGSLFNPLTLTCDFPYNVDCGERLIDFSTYACDPEDNYTTAHPERCDQFIQCEKERLHFKFCPPSTSFDYEKEECVARYKSKCRDKSIIDAEGKGIQKRSQRKKRRVVAPRVRFDCSFNYIAPHPDFCNKFVECEDRRVFIKDCGPGTAYNPYLGQCDWPHKVRRPDPEDCTRYQQCLGLRYVHKNCGEGTIFDAKRGTCVIGTREEYEANCKGIRIEEDTATPNPS